MLWRGRPSPRRRRRSTAPSAADVVDTAAIDAAKRELTARLDDLEKRVRAASAAARRPSRQRPRDADPADRRAARQGRGAGEQPSRAAHRTPADAARQPADEADTTRALKSEIATLRAALQSLDQTRRRPEGLGRQGHGEAATRQQRQRAEGAGRRARLGGDRHRRPPQRRARPRPALRHRSRPAGAARPRATPSSASSSRPCSPWRQGRRLAREPRRRVPGHGQGGDGRRSRRRFVRRAPARQAQERGVAAPGRRRRAGRFGRGQARARRSRGRTPATSPRRSSW